MSGAKLLREPPEPFRQAMSGLHQDIDIICRDEGLTAAQYVIGFVPPKDYSALGAYLDSVLGDPHVSSADLKGLINRHDTDVKFDRAGAARDFLEAVRDALRATRK